MIRIVADAMGGDFAPVEQVKGAVNALHNNKDVTIILVGDEAQIKAELANHEYDESRLEIVHTTETIGMEEVPTKAVKTKKDSSLVVAFRLLKEGKADALVSSGSTGAVLTAGVLILGRLKGVSRPALCPAIPNYRGESTFICDCGANLECKPVNLIHFAVMASAYAEAVYGVKNPRVGLLNNGTEDHKGLLLQQEVNHLLKEVDAVNYVGNIEGREIMYGDVDVVVSDGFTGNIILKTVEGMGLAVFSKLKEVFYKNTASKLAALVLKPGLRAFKDTMDYSKLGGAPIIGLKKPVIKAHGSSNAEAIKNAIRQAVNWSASGVTEEIERTLADA